MRQQWRPAYDQAQLASQFDGSYTLNPDRYDADHSNRTYMQEKLTVFLRFLGDRFGHNDYQIVIEGSQKISFSGRK